MIVTLKGGWGEIMIILEINEIDINKVNINWFYGIEVFLVLSISFSKAGIEVEWSGLAIVIFTISGMALFLKDQGVWVWVKKKIISSTSHHWDGPRYTHVPFIF